MADDPHLADIQALMSSPSSSPTIATQLFLPRPRRIWTSEHYAQMARDSSLPLHLYRSDRPEHKDITPLAHAAMLSVLWATPARFEGMPAALRALASPDVNTGPAACTELGALMISCFASLGTGDKEIGVMNGWRRKVSQHLTHMGVDGEDAWRQGAAAFRTAQQMKKTANLAWLHTEWRQLDILSRWDARLNDTPRDAPHNLKDPSPEGCLRLMQEWWPLATRWSDFPIDRVGWVVKTTPDPSSVARQLLERIEQWPAPELSPMSGRPGLTPGHALVAAWEGLARRGVSVTSPMLERMSAVDEPEFTAWRRQRLAVAEVDPRPSATPRRRYRT